MPKGSQISRSTISKNIAARIATARTDVGLSVRDAATQLGFDSYQTLSKIEKGTRPVRATELIRLAALYGRDVGYFLSAEKPAARPAVLWRGRAESPARAKVEQRFLQYCEDYARLEELAGHSPMRFPLKWPEKIESYSQVERAAQATSTQMGLGSCPASGLTDLLEDRFGVKVLVANTEGAGSAASVMDSFGAGILMNRLDAPWRMNFSLAHEIFHLITWDLFEPSEIHCGDAKTIPEKFADRFAAVLLLPEIAVRRDFESRVRSRALSYIDCLSMARSFGVSVQAMVWRLVSLRLVDSSSADAALKSEKLREMNKAERREDWADERTVSGVSKRFMALAIECLLAGRISRGRFAQLAGLGRGSIDAFLKAGGYDPSGDYIGEISTSTA